MTRGILTGTLLLAHGTEDQKKRFLPGIATGELMTAAAFTEPDFGSDSGGMITKATKVDGGYILNGSKAWCTFANRANYLTVLARTDSDLTKRHKGLSIFMVEKEPGEDIIHPNIKGEPIPTVGYHGMKSYNLSLEDVFVPEENLIGTEENRGFYQLMETYEAARLQTAARAVGVAQAAFDFALQYSKEREQFGKPISEQGVVMHAIAESRAEIEQARLLVLKTAHMMDTVGNKIARKEISMIKVVAPNMATKIIDRAIQVHGGGGVSSDFPLSYAYGHARTLRLADGPDEVHRMSVAKLEMRDKN